MERVDMHRLQELVRLHRMGTGCRAAARMLGMSPNYSFTFPWVPVAGHLFKVVRPDADLARQATFTALLMCLLLWAAARQPRRPLDWLLALFALIYWLTPLMLGPGYVAIVRSEAMLLPVVPLAKKLPIPALALIVLIALLMSLRISSLFFRSVIV